MSRRVVVTGLGAISPLGMDAKTTWENAKQGVNGIKTVDFVSEGFPITVAGVVPGYDPVEHFGKKESKKNDKFIQFAVISAKEAVQDSGLDIKSMNDTNKVGVFYGAGIGGLTTIHANALRGIEKGNHKLSPYFIPAAIINLAAGQIAIETGATGMATAAVTACASGTNAIGDAYRSIKDGYHDVILSGGSEATVTEFGLGGFASIKAVSKSSDPNRASIPFDAERSGFVMGEGGATLVLEEYEHAKARGAKIYCEIVGYGATCDAHHITAPHPEGKGAVDCIKQCIDLGTFNIDDVDYINAHGTSTPLNDRAETNAIKTVFGSNAKDLNVSSTKSMTGHLLGGSGALEAFFCCNAIADGFVPPTIGYKVPDEGLDLNYTPNKGVKRDINVALSNSLGFGGHNATIAFKKLK